MSGKVSCYRQDGDNVVLVGLVNKDTGSALADKGDYLVISAYDSPDSNGVDLLNVRTQTNGDCQPGSRATTPIESGDITVTP